MQFDVRLFDKNTLLRKTFPAQAVTSASWELIEKGFYGTFSLTLQRDLLDGYTSINGGDRVEIWVDGERRFRGYVAVPEIGMSTEGRSEVTGYGMAERLGTIICRKRYVYQTEVDLSQFVADLVADYVAPRIAGLVTDIQTTGFTARTLSKENSDARTVMTSLVELCANQAYWGIDVDPATGADRFFFRIKGTDEKYKLPIGKNVVSSNYPPDYSSIVNCVRVVGGEAEKPNMFANPSFEQPEAANETNANLLQNPSFEDDDYWMGAYAPVYRDTIQPRTGSYACMLHTGVASPIAWAEQSGRNISAGEEYVFGGRVYSVGVASYHITITPDVGTALRFPSTGEYPTDGIAEYQDIPECVFTAPAGSSTCAVRVTYENHAFDSPDIYLDDMFLYPRNKVAQPGWSPRADNGVISHTDMVYGDDSTHGAYSARMTIASAPAGKYGWLLPADDSALEVKQNQAYTFSLDMKDLTISAPVKFVLWISDTDGKERWVEGPEFAASRPDWGRVHWQWVSGKKDAKVWAGIKFMGAGDWLIDAVMFTEYNSKDVNGDTFIPGANYEWTFRVDDESISSRLPAVCQSSIVDHGLRDADESVDGMSDTATAESWAVGYFGKNAQAQISHAVDIVDCEDVIAPDGMVRLIGDGAEILAAAWPAKARYATAGDSIKLSLDLNDERPSFEKLLRDAVEEAKNEIKTGGTSSSIASTSGSVNLSSNHSRFHLLDGEDHTNVVITDLADGDVLAYDAEGDVYRNTPMGNDPTAVHKTGDETIGGVKTFSSSPVVPEPTNDADAASKGYVDSHAGVSSAPLSINCEWHGNGSVLQAGDIRWLKIPFAFAIDVAEMTSIQEGTIGVNLLACTDAQWGTNHPVVGDTIIGAGTLFQMTNSKKYTDSTLDGWTKTFVANTYLYFQTAASPTIAGIEDLGVSLTIHRT